MFQLQLHLSRVPRPPLRMLEPASASAGGIVELLQRLIDIDSALLAAPVHVPPKDSSSKQWPLSELRVPPPVADGTPLKHKSLAALAALARWRAAALSAHTRTKVAGYKTPKQFFVIDEMPRHPTGKPDYTTAQQVAAELAAR